MEVVYERLIDKYSEVPPVEDISTVLIFSDDIDYRDSQMIGIHASMYVCPLDLCEMVN
jgi:hypothetical protein